MRSTSASVTVSGGMSTTVSPSGRSRTPARVAAAHTRRPAQVGPPAPRRRRPSARTGGCRPTPARGRTWSSSRRRSWADRAATLASTSGARRAAAGGGGRRPRPGRSRRRSGRGARCAARSGAGKASNTQAGGHGRRHGQVPASEALAQAQEVGPAQPPHCSAANRVPVRPNPVATSSNTRSTPVCRQAATRRANDPPAAMRMPAAPCTSGSTTTAASSSACSCDHVDGDLEAGVVVEAGRPQHGEPERVEHVGAEARRRPARGRPPCPRGRRRRRPGNRLRSGTPEVDPVLEGDLEGLLHRRRPRRPANRTCGRRRPAPPPPGPRPARPPPGCRGRAWSSGPPGRAGRGRPRPARAPGGRGCSPTATRWRRGSGSRRRRPARGPRPAPPRSARRRGTRPSA